MSNLEIAKTIHSQLGGNKFSVMTGAKLSVINKGLQIRLTLGKAKIVTVVLDEGMDLYEVKFFSLRKGETKLLSSFEQVYCDELVDIFETNTGLYTHL